MSSNEVVKTVSKQLKYYFEVKRREDGFDLSGPDCPRLDHPPLKARPTLMYDGLHDRPLKHYFSPRSAKAVLTQFKVPEGKTDREKTVRKKLERNMRRYQFVHSTLPDTYYKHGKGNTKSLRPETVGYGVQIKRSKSPHKGSYPVLRSTPPDYFTRGEINRLVNAATKILVATETVDLKEDEKENSFHQQRSRPGTAKSYEQRNKRLPQIDEDGKQKQASAEESKKPKYTYDIHGRRVKVQQKSEDDVDSSYGTRPSSTHNSFMTINGEVADDKKVPIWLKKEMGHHKTDSDRSGDESWVRPHSAATTSNKSSKRPPSGKQRPRSAQVGAPFGGKKKKEHKPAKPKDLPLEMQPAAWDLEVCSSAPADSDDQMSHHSMEAAVQTPGELLREYDPMEKVIWEGERCRYRVHIFTGSRLGASTKADIKIVLCGDNGRIEEQWLHDSKNHLIKFQKGQEDIFDLETFYVGPLRKIAIGHDRQELGYGWFVDKVFVKDRSRCIRYEIPCGKWMSSKEGDGSTVKEFDVKMSTVFDADDEQSEIEYVTTQHSEPAVHLPEASPREEKLKQDPLQRREDTGSHTSVNTIPSETQDRFRKRKESVTSTYTSTSSSYESDPLSETESQTTPRARTPEKEKRLPVRKDDFFDQNVPERDYASVIESITGREDDFANERYNGRGGYGATYDHPNSTTNNNYQGETATLTLKGVDEEDRSRNTETRQIVNTSEFATVETETESETARLSVEENETDRSPPVSSKPEEDYMEGFKAGIEAAKKSAKEADENEFNQEESKRKQEEEFMKGPSIHHASKVGDLERIKALASYNSTLLTSPDEKGLCPIHLSASHGQTEVVQWLSVSVSDLDVISRTGYTPMHYAAMNGHTSCVMVLAAMGAQISTKTIEGQTPLHLAAKGGHMETVKWLVANRANIKAEDLMDRTALDIAEEYNHKELVTFLKACYKEQNDPDSSLAQLRNKSKQQQNDDSSDTSSSDSDSTTTSSDSSTDSSDSETWADDRKPKSSKRPMSAKGANITSPGDSRDKQNSANTTEDSEEDTKAKEKHDKEIETKRQLYEEQQIRMAEKHTSFLDSIRDEYS